MKSKTRSGGNLWILFILSLEGRQPAVRMRVWRALKALGAAVLRDGVYLLPNQPELTERLQEQAEEVTASGGKTRILEIAARDGGQDAEFRNLFDRTHDYEKLLHAVVSLKKSFRKIAAAELSAGLVKLKRELDAIVQQDFFPGPARDQASAAIEDIAAAANAVLSPDEPHSTAGRIQRVEPARYRNRTWATRARPWVDRLASAWLIKRFIDRRARFLWLKQPGDCPKRAVGFDFDGAAFTHVGSKVTFEVLAESFALESDPALTRIGALIHFMDVGGIPVPEAAGLESLLRGARSAFADDDRLLSEATRIFDLLHTSFTNEAKIAE
jgi:hypothetical protein